MLVVLEVTTPYNRLFYSHFPNICGHFACGWPTVLTLGCIPNLGMLCLVTGSTCLVNEIESVLKRPSQPLALFLFTSGDAIN